MASPCSSRSRERCAIEAIRRSVARWLPQIKQHKPELIGLLQAANDAPARPAASIEDLERPSSAMKVYRALVAMPNGQPARWLILLAPGCDLAEARQTLAHQFGPERVLEVIEHQAEEVRHD
ncbi:MAG: hypothetical protein MZV65_43060 [Chromatiales bacterium]|nr:hypothetical protein [Chromatiales bacterium]